MILSLGFSSWKNEQTSTIPQLYHNATTNFTSTKYFYTLFPGILDPPPTNTLNPINLLAKPVQMRIFLSKV